MPIVYGFLHEINVFVFVWIVSFFDACTQSQNNAQNRAGTRDRNA